MFLIVFICIVISANEDARTTSVQSLSDVTTQEYSATEPTAIGKKLTLTTYVTNTLNDHIL
jgi:hypothetical protein